MTKRAIPDQMIQYKHALMMYTLFRQCMPDNEFMHLNFQAKYEPETATSHLHKNPTLQCGQQYTTKPNA